MAATTDTKQIIYSLIDVGRIHPPKKQVLKGIYLSFYYGAKIGVLGDNGSGKSTLLRIMAGKDTEFTGQITQSKGYTVGLLEQEPQLWSDAVDATVQEVLKKLGKKRDAVKAIGVSGQQHGFVPLDKKGRVIRPAKLWCDTSTIEQCKQFETEFGGSEGLIELSGTSCGKVAIEAQPPTTAASA